MWRILRDVINQPVRHPKVIDWRQLLRVGAIRQVTGQLLTNTLVLVRVDRVRLVTELQPPTDLLSIPQVTYAYGEPQWNDIDRGKPMNSEKKPVAVPLCPPQIPHGLMRARIRASAVRPATNRLSVTSLFIHPGNDGRVRAIRLNGLLLLPLLL
jgi:hypothetical protein